MKYTNFLFGFLYNNIILIGMPNSGKTFLAKRLSEHTKIPVYDTDQLNPFFYETKTNKKDWRLFREQESIIIRTLIKKKEPKVISTGGGCIEDALLFNTLMNSNKNDTIIIHIIGTWKDNDTRQLPDERDRLWMKRGKYYFSLSDMDYWNKDQGSDAFLSWLPSFDDA